MIPFLLAAADFEARTLIIGLIVAVVVALVVYVIGLLLNRAGVPVPAALAAVIVGLLVFCLYLLDAFD